MPDEVRASDLERDFQAIIDGDGRIEPRDAMPEATART